MDSRVPHNITNVLCNFLVTNLPLKETEKYPAAHRTCAHTLTTMIIINSSGLVCHAEAAWDDEGTLVLCCSKRCDCCILLGSLVITLTSGLLLPFCQAASLLCVCVCVCAEGVLYSKCPAVTSHSTQHKSCLRLTCLI